MKKIKHYYVNHTHHVTVNVAGDVANPKEVGEKIAEAVASEELRVRQKDFAELIAERDHLRQQVQDLQAAGTALREVKREEDITYAVAEFHRKFGYPVRAVPAVTSGVEVRFRMMLMIEEFFETLDAVFPQTDLSSAR